MISLISDFDGTLYFQNENPHIRMLDRDKINQLQKHHLFGLCTGRPQMMVDCLEENGIHCDFFIFSSGAFILDQNKQIIFERVIPKILLQKIMDATSSYPATVLLGRKNMYAKKIEKEFKFPVQKISHTDEIQEEVIGISVRTENEFQAKNLCEKLKEQFDVSALQNNKFVDIVAKGCSKGEALKFIKKYLHIQKVGAIGDSYNDLDMLLEADQSFTFETSPKQVREVSTHIVNNVAEAIDIMMGKCLSEEKYEPVRL